jgi:hypothetical protein
MIYSYSTLLNEKISHKYLSQINEIDDEEVYQNIQLLNSYLDDLESGIHLLEKYSFVEE